ncbi:MAG: UDP-N-acetylmuramate--L-alanine ligase [Phycisphaerae bacterium]|jgi:UDP-N-acetylmuramate--alanine ligase
MRNFVDGATLQSQPVGTADTGGARVHFVGIGGSGMSGLAGLLNGLGADVTGSDLTAFDGIGPLVADGVRVSIGHREDYLEPGVEMVVVSAAIPETNPELIVARRRGVTVRKYAEVLGWLMRSRLAGNNGVAIAGTHGKSSTTAMCAHLCREAGLSPSFLVGARSEQLGGSSGLGSGSSFIVEACEFDRSFLHLSPASAAILNIEADHVDYYPTFDEIVAAFAQFAANVAPGGLLVVNGDDDWTVRAAEATPARVETFGFSERSDWRAINVRNESGCPAFEVHRHGERVLETRLSVPGLHNAANALAAVALAVDAGADASALAEPLSTYSGVCRRLYWRGQGGGVTIIDDYAHHPTEVRVSIEAVRYRYRPKRTWVVFQPHQNARTRHFMDDFAVSFGDVDEVIVPDVYGAREGDRAGGLGHSEELVDRICKQGGRAQYLPSLQAVTEHLTRHVVDGDLVLTMGAGDVWKVADELVERIC